MSKRTTMSQVGRQADVSTATVSYVLNGRGSELRIDPDTQERVRLAAERIGYRLPQSVGRGRRQIGVLFPNALGDYMGWQIAGIQEVLRTHDYHAVFCICGDDPTVERTDMDMFLRRRVQGIIAFPCDDEAASVRWTNYLEHAPPVVFLGRHPVDMDPPCSVEVDDELAGREAADILVREGCQQFVLISEKPGLDRVLARRRNGFLRGLADMEGQTPCEVHWRDHDRILQILKQVDRTTGIFAVRNSKLFPTIHLAFKKRMAIDARIVFAGAGLIEQTFALPNRFWVAQPPANEMGKRAALALLERIGEPVIVPAPLIMPMQWETNLLLEQHLRDLIGKL